MKIDLNDMSIAIDNAVLTLTPYIKSSNVEFIPNANEPPQGIKDSISLTKNNKLFDCSDKGKLFEQLKKLPKLFLSNNVLNEVQATDSAVLSARFENVNVLIDNSSALANVDFAYRFALKGLSYLIEINFKTGDKLQFLVYANNDPIYPSFYSLLRCSDNENQFVCKQADLDRIKQAILDKQTEQLNNIAI